MNRIIYLDAGHDAQPDDLGALTHTLREELEQLDLQSVDLVKTECAASAGTKSAEVIALALAISVLPTALPKLIDFIQAWPLRGQNRSIKIKANVGDRSLELEYGAGTSEAALRGLIDALTSKLTVHRSGNRVIW